jgi:ParB family chromosome partitioning protein
MAAKEKKGLGLGLDALFAANDLEEAEGELLTLPIAKVEPREAQPRKTFEEEALQTLADSIARYGLIQPIVARRLDSGYYQIIAGERRWRACRMAGLTEVPVRVITADDRRTAELALVENLQREDLNPIEEAKGYKTLMEDYGLTQEETAKSVGRSRPAVANSLRLLSLSPSVMALVEKKELSAGHARALLPLSSEKLQWDAAQTVLKRSLSVRRTEQLAARLRREQTAIRQNPDPLAVNYAAEAAEELSRLLGRKVRLLEGARGGRIQLDYYDAEDREVLIDALRRLKKEG